VTLGTQDQPELLDLKEFKVELAQLALKERRAHRVQLVLLTEL
jgi:hypothetical protein